MATMVKWIAMTTGRKDNTFGDMKEGQKDNHLMILHDSDPFSGERSRIPGKWHSYWEEAYPITPKHMYTYTISWTLTPP